MQRGLNYFKKGYVTDVEEIGLGDYEATVNGREIYTVHLHVEKGVVTEYDCDCPYDQGPVCKHIVAVLFYLQQDVLHLEEDIPTKKTAKKEARLFCVLNAAPEGAAWRGISLSVLVSLFCDACRRDHSPSPRPHKTRALRHNSSMLSASLSGA